VVQEPADEEIMPEQARAGKGSPIGGQWTAASSTGGVRGVSGSTTGPEEGHMDPTTFKLLAKLDKIIPARPPYAVYNTVMDQMDRDPDKKLIMSRGKATKKKDLSKKRVLESMDEGKCHWNTGKLYDEGKIDAVVIGYAKNTSAGWHQHTWGIKDGKIVETTQSNMSSTAYFGAQLTPTESQAFATMTRETPPSGL